MGSKGPKRRKPRRSLPKVKAAEGQGWALEHSPYSTAGELEGIRRFGRGAAVLRRTGGGWGLWLAWLVAAVFALGVLIGMAYVVFR